MSNIIQIDNLNKSFGSVNAVRNLSFRVKKGELSCIPWDQWCRKVDYNQYYVQDN